MPKLHVLLKKEELDSQRLEGKVVVVLDILFATSSIVTTLAHGASAVIAAPDGRAAHAVAATLPAGSWVLSGELNAETLPGFAHPTPLALLDNELTGRTLIYSTTNGTVALGKSAGADHVYAAALLNASAVVRHVMASHPENTVLVVCSGSADAFNLEDFLGAGCLVSLFAAGGEYELSDAALAAHWLYRCQPTLEGLRESRVGRMMLARGLETEVAFAAREDIYGVVPVLRDGRLVPCTPN